MKDIILEYMNNPQYKRHTLAMFFDVFNENYSDSEIAKSLNELIDLGYISLDKKDRYELNERLDIYRGTIQIKEKGFGFVVVENNLVDDIYISKFDINGAFNKDKVLVKITKNKIEDKKLEGKVLRVLSHGISYIIGRFYQGDEYSTIESNDKKDNFEIIVKNNNTYNALNNQIVKAEVINYISKFKVEAKIVDIVGNINDPGIDILSIVYKYNLNTEFTQDVIKQAQNIEETITKEELKNRKDLRDELIITIDGEDAKDLDDAVCVKLLPDNKYFLGVYIADVSHYVKENTPIDKEAYIRGTSVYLADRVIPMIPHRLSNGICSLNPNVDRLVLGCEMIFDSKGNRDSYEIIEGVINSKYRMTYTNVNKILFENDKDTINDYSKLVPMLYSMKELSNILRSKRSNRGGIDFEIKESQIDINEDGNIIDINARIRLDGEKLIEDFMLAANETVAEHFHWLDLPFIYRIHDEPNDQKLEKALRILRVLGYSIKGTKNIIHPSVLRDLLKQIMGSDREKIINTLILRSMSKAKYSEHNIGHYGLAADFYTHFTSPIRRYPDTIVHRLIREFIINKKIDDKNIQRWEKLLPQISVSTSLSERTAVECEREVEDMKKAEYMERFVGYKFNGIISSILPWGIFVELENTVEGLVHVNELNNDYYIYDEDNLALVGRRTGIRYQIGDKVEIKVIRASKESKEVDFEIINKKSKKTQKIKKRKGPNFIKRDEWVANRPKRK